MYSFILIALCFSQQRMESSTSRNAAEKYNGDEYETFASGAGEIFGKIRST